MRGGGSGTMELGARTGECALRPAVCPRPSIPAGSGPGGGGPPQPRGQVNLLHLPGAWAIGGAQCGPAHPPRRLPRSLCGPWPQYAPPGRRAGADLGPRRTQEHLKGCPAPEGPRVPPGCARPRRTLAPSPRARRPRSGPPLGSALPRCCGNPRSRGSGLGLRAGLREGVERSPSGALRGRGAAGSLGRDASSRETLSGRAQGFGRGKALCLSVCRLTGNGVLLLGSVSARESSLVESRVLNY